MDCQGESKRYVNFTGPLWMSLTLLIGGITFCCPFVVQSQSLKDLFNQGLSAGQLANPQAQATLSAPNATQQVPGFNPTTVNQNQTLNPNLNLQSSAQQNIHLCATTPTDPTCAGVNFSQVNPGLHAVFPLSQQSPLFTNAKTITADPGAIAKNLSGTYSACTTQTIPAPVISTTLTCHQANQSEKAACFKTLSVAVTDNGLNCTAGTFVSTNAQIMPIRPYVYVGAVCSDALTFQWSWGFSECNGTNATIKVNTHPSSTATQRNLVDLGCGGSYYIEGQCQDGQCQYSAGIPKEVSGNCSEYCDGGCCAYDTDDVPLATLQFTQPVHSYSTTDNWINQCSAYEGASSSAGAGSSSSSSATLTATPSIKP